MDYKTIVIVCLMLILKILSINFQQQSLLSIWWMTLSNYNFILIFIALFISMNVYFHECIIVSMNEHGRACYLFSLMWVERQTRICRDRVWKFLVIENRKEKKVTLLMVKLLRCLCFYLMILCIWTTLMCWMNKNVSFSYITRIFNNIINIINKS